MQLLSTFITGMQQVVAEVLADHGIRHIDRMLDGAVCYTHMRPIALGCMHNTFEVLAQTRMRREQPMEALASAVLSQAKQLPLSPMRTRQTASFRIVVSRENGLVSLDSRRREALETLIRRRTGLVVNRSRADVEFWLLSRSEGYGFFLRRIPRTGTAAEQPVKGELRGELVYLLNYLSGPNRGDVFLDPFCGSGAIPLSRMRMGGFAHLYATDVQRDCALRTRARLSAAHGYDSGRVTVAVCAVDALADVIPPGSVDRIVTDPPWGLFARGEDIPALYHHMLRAFAAICTPDARLVLLSAQKEILADALTQSPDWTAPMRQFDILVSGKKAGVYVAKARERG